MTFPRFELSAERLFRYTIASGDMYYEEREQRDIFIGKDDDGHVRIWGELVGGGPASRVELCRVFLEYALYCRCCYTAREACARLQLFGQRMGRRLAAFLQKNPTLISSKNSALGALECLFGTIRASYFEDYADSGARFVVTDCPLEEASRRSGLPDIELARSGINAMCQSLCLGMDPGVVVNTLPSSRPELVFTVLLPVAA